MRGKKDVCFYLKTHVFLVKNTCVFKANHATFLFSKPEVLQKFVNIIKNELLRICNF